MHFFSNNDDELALYDSMVEEEEEACCFCGKNTVDALKFGKKVAIDDVTVHHFCLVSFYITFLMFTYHVSLELYPRLISISMRQQLMCVHFFIYRFSVRV